MATKTYAGKQIEVTDEGYLVNADDWSKEVATDLAKEEDLELTDKHFALLDYIRTAVLKGDALTIRRIGKSGIVDIKGFYQLFPGAPLRKASKVAGIPKPTSCV